MRQSAKLVMLQVLRAYKWGLSPLLPTACRYVPTCSEYAMEAIERYGAPRGGWMTLGRVLRCHPFGGSGYDPVLTPTRYARRDSRGGCPHMRTATEKHSL